MIKIWNVRTYKCEYVLTGHTGSVNSICVLLDGRIASGSDDGTIKIWDIRARKCENTLTDIQTNEENPGKLIDTRKKYVGMLPDGRIISFSGDKTLNIWS